ncbi:hypothetical protein B9W68_17170 [Streptomyces sp. CS227]|uniref:hypothetical protein n=1 Tax=Streptomyces sp. CS227 TaxID=1982763 RepID=UPI000B41090A|nr:hypothetical protein [Streptomyces sp. CS227]OWA09625.1 hypothetical protein B9W68_17170 [Streptomyces sp. CS227]
MPDLTVDFHLLSQSNKQLRALRDEFKGMGEWKEDIRADVGAGDLQKAMSEFIDNWDKNRERLLESLTEVGKMVKGTRDAFKNLDDELAKAGKGGK